ncbi:MAG: hypothetical protein ACYC96_00250 [Fimbriimonadaceae bacterium]
MATANQVAPNLLGLIMAGAAAISCGPRKLTRAPETCSAPAAAGPAQLPYGEIDVKVGTVRPGDERSYVIPMAPLTLNAAAPARIVASCSCMHARFGMEGNHAVVRFNYLARGSVGTDQQSVTLLNAANQPVGRIIVTAVKHLPIEVVPPGMSIGNVKPGDKSVGKVTFVTTTLEPPPKRVVLSDKRLVATRRQCPPTVSCYAISVAPSAAPGVVEATIRPVGGDAVCAIYGNIIGALSFPPGRIYEVVRSDSTAHLQYDLGPRRAGAPGLSVEVKPVERCVHAYVSVESGRLRLHVDVDAPDSATSALTGDLTVMEARKTAVLCIPFFISQIRRSP